MPSTIASVTDLIIDDFNSATEFGEFTIQKLTDAASPKFSDDAARKSSDSLIPNNGDDLVFDLGGADASGPDRFPTETMKMTYGAIEWTDAPDGRDALPLEQVTDAGSQHELEHVSFTYQKIVGEYHGNDGDIVHPLESLHPGFDLMF